MAHQHGLQADVSVRPSVTGDAATLGLVHVQAWRASLAGLVPPSALDELDPETFTAAWRAAIAEPPSAKHRMLTACAGPQVVGFAALAPAPQTRETGEIVALEVHPEHARAGHGSRLLAACTDILRSTGATHVRAWAVEGDEARAAFLTSAGLEPIGVRRVLEVAGATVYETAWSAVF
ncbi:GNAT family N-acetyltransferase [Ruania halotolerans]|uniref:GNAT family N-acetyltransferase n=1 Tax=Ruania halotolerans TaxID=2897773 RepID=UPI001E38329B|nr:GNAT family N-acetyltransferase [Ruania halotolerans]UFU05172.1 GNAT family N-acetyltransferase [Ruania halotolerans]